MAEPATALTRTLPPLFGALFGLLRSHRPAFRQERKAFGENSQLKCCLAYMLLQRGSEPICNLL
jgi:hypothetical protein